MPSRFQPLHSVPRSGRFLAPRHPGLILLLLVMSTAITPASETVHPENSISLDPLIVTAANPRPAPDGFPISVDTDSTNKSGGTYQDLFELIPGAFAGSAAGAAFSLRGMAQDNTVSYAGIESNPLIQVFENGIPLSPTTLRYLPPVLWDLDRAAIHSGPYFLGPGPVGLGGALLLEGASPDFTNGGKSMMEAAEAETFRVGMARNFTLVPDELAFRLSFFHQQSEGHAENIFLGDTSFGATDRQRLQAALRWHPGKDPERTLELSVTHESSEGNPFARVQELPGHDLFDRKTNLNLTPNYPAERWAASLKSSFLLPGELRLETTTSIQHLDVDLRWDPDYTSVLNWVTEGRIKEQRLIQDLTVAGPQGRLQWRVGAYFEAGEYDSAFHGSGFFPTPEGLPFDNAAAEQVRVAAAHGRLDWEFSPGTRLTGGLRINHEQRELQTRSNVGTLPEARFADEYAGTDLLPEVGLTWQADDGLAGLGLRLVRGSRAGGISHAHALGLTRPFESESDTVIEAVSRYQAFSGLELSGSLFHSWLEDQQIPFNVPGGLPELDTLVTNAASSRRYGAVLESRWQVLDELAFGGSLAWTHTEFHDFNDQGTDRSGQAFPNAPEWTASIKADYQHPSGWFGKLVFSWADTSYSDVRNPAATALEARHLLSARLGYAWEHCRLYLFGSNLLDDDYAVQRSAGTTYAPLNTGIVGAPRMLGIRAELTW